MSSFDGYLIAFGTPSNGYTAFPHEYMAKSPVFIPNQRTEAEAYRDANNDLHRVTIDNHKTRIELTTLPGLTNFQKAEIETAMSEGLLNTVERKYHIKFWNDDVNAYREGDFYLADVSYTYRSISARSIVYEEIKYVFIEY